MEDKYYLIKFHDNWADEMDLEGFVILDQADWFAYQAAAKMAEYPVIYGVGTNEEIEYHSYDNLKSSLSIKQITASQRATLIDLLSADYGFFPPLDLFDKEEED